MKHTPGPWVLIKNPKTNWYDLRIVEAEWSFGGIYGENAEANARLIAAAPDLLKDKIKDFNGIGKWLSSALEDPNVCEEMKQDIREWFDRFSTVEKATGLKIEEVLND